METERTRDEEEGRWKQRGLGMKKKEDGNRED